MFIVRYFAPYGGGWREQSFDTRERAESMAAFYRSCGSSASVIRR